MKTFKKTCIRKKPIIFLFCLAGLLVVSALIVGLSIYNEGNTAQDKAQKLLTEYEQSIHQQPIDKQPIVQDDSSVEIPVPLKVVQTFEGYPIIGKLKIERLEIELPIIAYTDDEALKVSICYYSGALPGEAGNLLITGHNYSSGAHFGHLDKLELNDTISLHIPDGSEYQYQVYKIEVIKPDEVDELQSCESNYELTLLTCTNRGNRRLIVKCKLVDALLICR